MKKITRLILSLSALFFCGSYVNAQSTIDFETVGNNWTWTAFENGTNPNTFSVVTNPETTGVNTSANCAKFIVNADGASWAGVESLHGAGIGNYTLSSSNCILKIMVYKSVISPVGIKLVTSSGWSRGQLLVSNTKINEWEELTIDFSSFIDGVTYDQIVIMPDFPTTRTAGSTCYFDNISFNAFSNANDTSVPTSFTATKGTVTDNSVELLLNATDNSGSVNYTISYGTTTVTTSGTSGVQKSYTVTGLSASTDYNFSVVAKDAAGNAAANNPIEVLATTPAVTVSDIPTIDFETVGNNWTWTAFENGTNPNTFSVVTNPETTGVNTSANCAKFIVNADGALWAGVESLHGSDIGNYILTASNSLIKIMVYKSVISPVGIKLVTSSGWSRGQLLVSNTKINEWEELTIDFSSFIDGVTYDQIVVMPDFPTTRTAGSTCYFDNISFNAVPVIISAGDPTVAAPTPTLAAANVISMFSNAYTNVPVNTWRTDWSSGGTLTDLQIAGNDTKKYANLNYAAVETTGTNLIDATNMNYFHVDVWTDNVTTFKVKLVDFGADGVYSGGDDKEHELTFTPTFSTWNSYNMALSDFSTITNRSHIAQLIFYSSNSNGTVYIDNVYFSKTSTGLSDVKFETSISCFPNPFVDQFTVSAKSEISQVIVRNLVGQTLKSVSLNSLTSSINASDIPAGNYIITVKLANGQLSTQKLIKL